MGSNMTTRMIALLFVATAGFSSSSAGGEIFLDTVYYFFYPYRHAPYRYVSYGYPTATYYAYQEPRRSNHRRVAQQQARAVQQQNSAVACDAYAGNYARETSAQGDILAGGAIGSLAGLGIGALFA